MVAGKDPFQHSDLGTWGLPPHQGAQGGVAVRDGDDVGQLLRSNHDHLLHLLVKGVLFILRFILLI